MCNTRVCVDWKLDKHELTLTCKITNVRSRVYIYGPHGNIQAVCLPPYLFNCEAYYTNGSIVYNAFTKEFRFKVKDETDKKIAGNWTCRHGTRRDASSVFISEKTSTGTSK